MGLSVQLREQKPTNVRNREKQRDRKVKGHTEGGESEREKERNDGVTREKRKDTVVWKERKDEARQVRRRKRQVRWRKREGEQRRTCRTKAHGGRKGEARQTPLSLSFCFLYVSLWSFFRVYMYVLVRVGFHIFFFSHF